VKDLKRSPTWLDGDKNHVAMSHIIAQIKKHKNASVSVGCDSHKVGGKYLFAVVIAIHIKGYGGFFFFRRKKRAEQALDKLKYRLMEETKMSIDVASEVRKLLSNERRIDVHLDINTCSKYASFPTLQPATSWVKAMGFNAIAKPDAWAASCLADSFAK
tara:strand:+ start:3800 stop:4276 length:477 start_codon:yes stop_codon:yes gene_type:complete